jgi:competence protein ComEC
VVCTAANEFSNKTLKALQDLKIPTYATCFNGNITALSNGKTIEFTIEKGDVW